MQGRGARHREETEGMEKTVQSGYAQVAIKSVLDRKRETDRKTDRKKEKRNKEKERKKERQRERKNKREKEREKERKRKPHTHKNEKHPGIKEHKTKTTVMMWYDRI